MAGSSPVGFQTSTAPVLVAALLGLICAPQARCENNANTNNTLKTVLFYTCATKAVDNQCNESFSLDQANYANTGFTSNFTTVEQGAKVGIQTLFATHDTFFVNGKGLRPDWQPRWEALKTKLVPLIEAKAVVGFFVGDELFPGKITVQEFETALAAIAELKAEYPWLVSWENEGGTAWVDSFAKDGIPDNLDIISFDDYYLSVEEHRKFHEEKVYPLLKPHQSTFLVPGTFATNGTSSWIHGSQWCCGVRTTCAVSAVQKRNEGSCKQTSRIGRAPVEVHRSLSNGCCEP
eukprot:m.298062 g.298062  ORF g.298062 m.298062 type:complete len:291 (-) comp19534_c6_seq1:73-945(-)